MKRLVILAAVLLLTGGSFLSASTDTFGTGSNQFAIEFVEISGDTNPASGYGTVNNDYRMGMFEITNEQFSKFTAINPGFTGADIPVNDVTWFQAAQFVNFLNTSKGEQPAYKFAGDQMSMWEPFDEGYDQANPFRNSNAKYFLPTEDEWVKAAYFNGAGIQTFATPDGTIPLAGTETNYDNAVGQPWDVASGSEELNGTFDMMGNVWEWMENPFNTRFYMPAFDRCIRGGSFTYSNTLEISSFNRANSSPYGEANNIGFRVASVVPEPCSLVLLSIGGLMLRRRKR